ncbi:MAG: hypothetical protein A3H70_04565 [Candidatus Komeilibacteria bacterium RIFCSPLOWO2_02_FULL_48_11]|uniref:PDZ domain-containing protein n=1 Tax=Candidatus Komeilibacteria bacterium RIFCSPLOWO2_02_FULL_48_11 TaxID=1798553 RepID=A0A1G2BVA7_9BACT|nr:MAG: hypothetical protein A3H70_04565 [Candidatus Komeilibacteria bacterium RIFCSPLOWO2_02_FULL_48_11]
MTFLKKYLSLYAVIIIVIAAFVGGFYVGKSRDDILVVDAKGEPIKSGEVKLDKSKVKSYLGRNVDFDLYLQVWQMLQERYVDQPVSATKLFYGSLEGLVAALDDPYSVFLTPQISQEFNEQLNGRFEGIGAEIGIKNKSLAIIAPLSDSPAEAAGLRSRDKILAIDKETTDGLSLDEAVSRIRGPKGTNVVLTIKRDEAAEPFEVTVTRDTIHVKSVSWKMEDGNIAYIELTNFNQDTTDLFKRIAREVVAANPQGLILDLRNNSGGFLQTAIDVASLWIDRKVVLNERSQVEGEKKYLSEGQPLFASIPTVVLVNGGTASSSEIVAGALQDYGLARLVGEKTFGKGSVQMLEDLSDGSSVKFTVAKWYTPHDRSIDHDGIMPDEEVKLTPEDYSNDKDPQLDRAMEYFKNK